MGAILKDTRIGVFPAVTLTQLEEALEERQLLDRRKLQKPIDFTDRRRVVRRVSDQAAN